METNGTVNKITFKMVKIPFAELSSKANELQDKIAKIKVYAKTILLFNISSNMIFMILFMIQLRVSGFEFQVAFALEYLQ